MSEDPKNERIPSLFGGLFGNLFEPPTPKVGESEESKGNPATFEQTVFDVEKVN